MLKKLTPLVIILLLAFPLVAQFPKPGSGSGAGGGSGDATSIQGRAVASTAPANLECLLWDAGGSTWEPGACAGSTTGAAMAAADYPVVRTIATVLTLPAIAAGFARIGEVLSAAISSATFTVTSGTGTLWIALASDLTVVVRHNVVGTCSATCTAVGSATGFEPGDLPLYQWTVTSGSLAATGTGKLTPYGSRPLVAGTKVSFGHTAGVTTINGGEASATDTVVGIVELATSAETTTGTDATRAVTPDGLAGSDFGKRTILIELFQDTTAVTTGDGKFYLPVPDELAGWNIIHVSAHLGAVVSSSGAVTIDLARCAAVATGIRCSGTVADILSTNSTVDANEDGTETAATPAVIDTANDDLPTAGHIRFDVDGAGTSTQGLLVKVTVQKP